MCPVRSHRAGIAARDSQTFRRHAVLLLVVGMTAGAARSSAVQSERLQPIVSRSRANRICVELCSGALGGAACGDFCLDLVPDGLPVQYGRASGEDGGNSSSSASSSSSSSSTSEDETSKGVRSSTRESVCGVLCENNLGYPLCQCEIKGISKKRDRPNFLEVCAVYCNAYDYQLRGCQECSLYQIPMKKRLRGRKLLGDQNQEQEEEEEKNYQPKYDWGVWCTRQCSADNGGAACDCDMLPMMASS